MATEDQVQAAYNHVLLTPQDDLELEAANQAAIKYAAPFSRVVPDSQTVPNAGKFAAGVVASTISGLGSLAETINDFGALQVIRNAIKSNEMGYGYTGAFKSVEQGGMPKTDWWNTATLLDNSLGSDYAEYYQANKTAIDATSLIAQTLASFPSAIRGTAGIGVKNLIGAGEPVVNFGANALGKLSGGAGKLSPVGVAESASELLASGTVTNNMSLGAKLVANWEQTLTAGKAVEAAQASGVWQSLQTTRWAAVGANAAEESIRFLAADALVTGSTFYHPFYEGKSVEEKIGHLAWSPLFGAGVGSLIGVAKYGEALREVSAALEPVKKAVGFGKLFEGSASPVLATGDDVVARYSLLFGKDSKFLTADGKAIPTEQLEGLVGATLRTGIEKSLLDISEKGVDITPLANALLNTAVTPRSVADVLSGVTKISRPTLEAEIGQGVSQSVGRGSDTLITSRMASMSTGKVSENAVLAVGDLTHVPDTGLAVLGNNIILPGVKGQNIRYLGDSTFATELSNLDTVTATANRLVREAEIAKMKATGVLELAPHDIYGIEGVYRSNVAIIRGAKEVETGLVSASDLVPQVSIKGSVGKKFDGLHSTEDLPNLLTAMKAEKARELVAAGKTSEEIALILNAPEAAVRNGGNLFSETGAGLRDAAKADKIKLTYGTTEVDKSTGFLRQRSGILQSQWDLRATAILEESNKLRESATADAAARVLGAERAAAIQDIKGVFSPESINLTKNSGRTLLRSQNTALGSAEAYAQHINKMVLDDIGEGIRGFNKSPLATELGIIAQEGQAGTKNLKAQEVMRKVLDHDFETNGRLFYSVDADGRVTGIVTNEYQKALENKQRLVDALTTGKLTGRKALAAREKINALDGIMAAEMRNPAAISVPEEVRDLFTALRNQTNALGDKHNYLASARGEFSPLKERKLDQVVITPVNRASEPYGVFVKRVSGSVYDDGEVVLLTGRTQAEAEARAAIAEKLFNTGPINPVAGTRVDIIRSWDARHVATYKQLEGTYDYAQSFNSTKLGKEMVNKGELVQSATALPTFDLLTAQAEGIRHNITSQIKQSYELSFARELKTLDELHTAALAGKDPLFKDLASTGSAAWFNKAVAEGARTPFSDVAAMLRGERQVASTAIGNWWDTTNRIATGVADGMLRIGADQWRKWRTEDQTAAEYIKNYGQILADRGLDKHVAAETMEAVLKNTEFWRTEAGKKFIEPGLTSVKNFLSNWIIRRDAANSILNVASMPITHTPVIREAFDMLSSSGRMTEELRAYLGVGKDGAPGGINFTKNYIKSVMDGSTKLEASDWLVLNYPQTVKAGMTRREAIDSLKLYESNEELRTLYKHEQGMMDAMSGGLTLDSFGKMKTVADAAAKLELEGLSAAGKVKHVAQAPLRWLDEFSAITEHEVRYAMADMGLRMAELSGAVGAVEAKYLAGSMVGVASGLKHASQRGQLFEGVIGSSATMFQNYSFNLANVLLRSLENGDARGAILMTAMQAGIHGVRTLPGFDTMNKALIGERNRTHGDIPSTLYAAGGDTVAGQALADFVLYGAASNLTSINFFSRADATPRSLTVVPTSIGEMPSVKILSQIFGNIINTSKMMMATSDAGMQAVGETLVKGIEHNGLWRPAAQLAARLQGYSTTTHLGTVNMRYNDDIYYENRSAGLPAQFANMFGMDSHTAHAFSYAASLVGSRPLNEAIILDASQSRQHYQIKDKEARKGLTAAMASLVAGGRDIKANEELMLDLELRYANMGGTAKGFAASVANAYRAAGKGSIDSLSDKLNDKATQNFQRMLGANRDKVVGGQNYWYPGKGQEDAGVTE